MESCSKAIDLVAFYILIGILVVINLEFIFSYIFQNFICLFSYMHHKNELSILHRHFLFFLNVFF